MKPKIIFAEEHTAQVEYEMTIPTEQFGNLKPKIIMKCKASEIEQALDMLRDKLREEYKKVRTARQGD